MELETRSYRPHRAPCGRKIAYLQALAPELFWDADLADADDIKHRRFVIERMPERGGLSD